eukprot:TRINITY_DN3605_c0_g1_i1.p2 TRINITY_DN3605_c0_g1~~TRINITY_DN3605_c0_g1_i1.p2  ORF type:complete len:128 (+),score=22.25 TRINITY_DN3605_c0_g1_i1:276-659(+)
MKGAVHAASLGFEVHTVQDLCAGGSDQSRDQWVEGESYVFGDKETWQLGYNAPTNLYSDVEEYRRLVQVHGESALMRDWCRQIYDQMGDPIKGGPQIEEAWDIMRRSGVHIATGIDDLVDLVVIQGV